MKYIFIFSLGIMMFLSAGCGMTKTSLQETQKIEVQKNEVTVEPSVSLSLNSELLSTNTIGVDVLLLNPKYHDIDTLKLAFAFDTHKLRFLKKENQNSFFDVVLSENVNQENDQGFITTERSTSFSKIQEKLFVTRFVFEILPNTDGAQTALDFIGFDSRNENETGVFSVHNNKVYNILIAPKIPLLSLKLPPVSLPSVKVPRVRTSS